MDEEPRGEDAGLPKWLHDLAVQIDTATDRRDRQQLLSLALHAEDMGGRDEAHRSELLYFSANAYSAIDGIDSVSQDYAWEWEKAEATKEILLLRSARAAEQYRTLSVLRQCQICTNLGNALNKVGRPVEAIAAWDEAIKLVPTFAMALGNRAYGLGYFANALYDVGHRACLLVEAKASFDRALDSDALWESGYQPIVAAMFAERRDHLATITRPEWAIGAVKARKNELGRSADERGYREWRLRERLFLNPLNDLGDWAIAARDVYHLPSHSMGLGDPPRFVRFYDLMKQEFVAACALFYEGMPRDDVFFADREVLLFEHGDYEMSGIQLEKQKAAYRLAYSVLDKVAGFINDYFSLGRGERLLTFRNVWYSHSKGSPRALDRSLVILRNWGLRGLHALSKDLFDREQQEVAEPNARAISELRNAMEHRFVSVHDFGAGRSFGLAHTVIEYREFCARAVQVLKLARAALTYLSMAVHAEERRRLGSSGPEAVVVEGVLTPRRR
jgi:hypothetical protein